MSEDIKPIADESGVNKVVDTISGIAGNVGNAVGAIGSRRASVRVAKVHDAMHARQVELEKHQWDTGLAHIASQADLTRTHQEKQFGNMLKDPTIHSGEFNEHGPKFGRSIQVSSPMAANSATTENPDAELGTSQKASRTRAANSFIKAHAEFYAKDKKGNFLKTRESHPEDYSKLKQMHDKVKSIFNTDVEGFTKATNGLRPGTPPKMAKPSRRIR